MQLTGYINGCKYRFREIMSGCQDFRIIVGVGLVVPLIASCCCYLFSSLFWSLVVVCVGLVPALIASCCRYLFSFLRWSLVAVVVCFRSCADRRCRSQDLFDRFVETSSDSDTDEISPIDYEALVFDNDALLYKNLQVGRFCSTRTCRYVVVVLQELVCESILFYKNLQVGRLCSTRTCR